MEYRSATIDAAEIAEGRGKFDREVPTCGSVIGGMRNKCVVFPVKSSMVAESFETSDENWIVRAKPEYESDLIVQVEGFNFHLHKLPMAARSKYLNRMILQRSNHELQANRISIIQIHNLPGGTMAFELVAKFCYGWKIELTARNVAPVYCAAHLLEMTDDLAQGNLISKAEAFMSFVISSSWKDTFKVLASCEPISPFAKRLQISNRCAEAIASKACISPESFCNSDFNEDNIKLKSVAKNWWFKDVSALRIDHFIEVIESVKRKGMKSAVVGSCVEHWTMRWFRRVTAELQNLALQHLSYKLQRVTVESLVRLLPVEEGSVASSFLLHLLKLGLAMEIESKLLIMLEARLAMELETCHAQDLLVKNYVADEDNGVYDVAIVTEVVKCRLSIISTNSRLDSVAIGRLVDEYLMLVAEDERLKAESFRALVEALPENARVCCDNLYRATDMYLKAHPGLTEEERTCLCKSLKYHKLSQVARGHIMRNDRLPLKFVTSFILLEQVNTAKPITAFGSTNNGRAKTRVVVRDGKSVGLGWMDSQKEINLMKREVETMKVKLNDIQMCKSKLQGQVKKGFNYKRNLANVRRIVCLGFGGSKLGSLSLASMPI